MSLTKNNPPPVEVEEDNHPKEDPKGKYGVFKEGFGKHTSHYAPFNKTVKVLVKITDKFSRVDSLFQKLMENFMISHKWFDDPHFWNALKALEVLSEEIDAKDFCQLHELAERDLVKAVYFLHLLQCKFQVRKEGDRAVLVPPKKLPRVRFEFLLSEWLAFQAHFPLLEKNSSKVYHSLLANKIADVEQQHQSLDLFEALSSLSVNEDSEEKPWSGLEIDLNSGLSEALKNLPHTMAIIEYCILNKLLVLLEFEDGRKVQIFPHRLVHLDGRLHIVGEETNDSCILYFSAESVTQIEPIEETYQPQIGEKELGDFISGMRSVSENSVRLILKIPPHLELDLNPIHHYLENPVLITNPRNEMIWAATLEPCEDLYNWLYQLGDQVEILDPDSFIEEFRHYCSERLNKAA